MDFASLMAKEIAKAKQKPAPALSAKTEVKYLKRAEVEQQREAAYRAEQETLRTEKEERARRKRRVDEDEAERNRERDEKRRRLAEQSRKRREEEEAENERRRRKRLGLPELPPQGMEETPADEGDGDIADDDLVAGLRDAGEPARLFGESHRQRLRRFKRLDQKQIVGFTTLELLPEEQMKVDVVPNDKEGKKFLFRQLASYFTMVLKEWETALNQRPASVQESFQGKAAYNAMDQARDNMRPLFRKFEAGELDVLEAVVEIVKAAQERRYVDANDGYLRLSIGKAAWPIGVTMVGIHERSAREKLHESEAHIMSDEVTRKFLQSIKRCLSFAQTRWPPEDQLQLMG
ncbi:MAG: mRNA splicing protein prp18 [Thelocarpon impressellum]|nr:MAG: mRNA splicing protein prp18 [Thelocarpon impressellum]